MNRDRFACASIALALALFTNVASADSLDPPTNAEADAHLKTANQLYRLGDFEKAIAEYKAGALKEYAPVFHHNLGQCYRQLGQYKEAIWHYERFLERGQPDAKLKKRVEDWVEQMKSELAQKAKTQPPLDAAPYANQPPASSVPSRTIAAEPTEHWYSDVFGWGLAGAGLASTGVAIGLFVSAKGLDDDANMTQSQVEQDALRERAGDRRLAGAILVTTGGALLVAGIVKLAINPRREPTTTTWKLGVSRNGLAVMRQF